MRFVRNLFICLFLFAGLGCSKPPSSKMETNQVDPASLKVTEWKSVRLTDLPGKPVIVSGRTEDREVTYVQIQTAKKTTTYKINDNQGQAILQEVSNNSLSVPSLEPLSLETFAREAQNYLLYARYSEVWRCRYSSAWRELAAQDIREAGPLLLNIQVFENYDQAWTWLIGIDQVNFEVVGISGVKGSWWETESLFGSSVIGQNHLFGLPSEATISFSAYFYLCSEAYGREFLNPGLKSVFSHPRFIAPEKEKEISEYMELKADMLKMDPKEKALSYVFCNKEALDTKSLISNTTLKDINNLIQLARSNKGVGL